MGLAPLLDTLGTAGPTIVDASLRGAIGFVIALVVALLLRRRSAAARHLVWASAIVVQLAIPVFALWGPRWRLAVSPAIASVLPLPHWDYDDASQPTPDRSASAAFVQSESSAGAESSVSAHVMRTTIASAQSNMHAPMAALQDSAGVREIGTANVTHSSPLSRRTFLTGLWVLGAIVVLGRLAIGTAVTGVLARRSQRVDDPRWLALAQRVSVALHIDRPVTLLRSRTFAVPVTWGIIYPIVLLPEDADDWPEERREFVLVHEMAHVKRLDALTQLVGQLALAIFWFDPLVWIANRRMQLEREHACDDYVIRHGSAPSAYADALLSMVRTLSTSDRGTPLPAFAALAMARRSELEGRMLSILDPVLDRHPLGATRTIASVLAALCLVVPLAALRPYRAPEGAQLAVSSMTPPLHTVTSRPVSQPSVSVARRERGGAIRVAPLAHPSKENVASIERAVASMSASTDKRRVLEAFGQTSDRDMLLMVMRASDGISSSAELGRLLRALEPRYLSSGDHALASAYFEQAKRLSTSGDLHRVLRGAVPYAARSPELAMRIIDAADKLGPSSDRAAVLIALLDSGAISTGALHDALLHAATQLAPGGVRDRVLMFASRH